LSRTATPSDRPLATVATRDATAEAACALLTWFGGRTRDVPWREDSDPYRVWVGEVMAQQTRLGVMRPYYDRFLARFPTVDALAAADSEEVLKEWEGLGYYARARNLLAGAREVMASYGGEVPGEPDDLRGLPGVGAYISGAIASIAFDRPVPAVDGNTRRVLSRLFDIESPTPALLRDRALGLIAEAPDRAADINQALMDLGAAICTPSSPACDDCPVEPHCLARARGTIAERPPRRAARQLPHYDIAVAIVWHTGQVLIARRPEDGLLGGLWEFPGGKIEPGEGAAEAARREVREEMGVEIEVGEQVASVDHAYSHFRITLHAFHARYVSGDVEARSATAWRWVALEELDQYAFPTANKRIIRTLSPERSRAP
jgi:A/G-specific adenine glycosylase